MSYNLTIDQGNTQSKIMVWDHDSHLVEWRTAAQPGELGPTVRALVEAYRPERGLYCSVAIVDQYAMALARTAGCDIELFTPQMPTPIDFASGYETARLGADRMAAIVGARGVFAEGAVCVADIGTATTIDWLDGDNRFGGGIIIPGPQMQADALNHYTQRLPRIDMAKYLSLHGDDACGAEGHNTAQAIVRGITSTLEAQLKWRVARATCRGVRSRVIFTGGYGEYFYKQLRRLGTTCYEPALVSLGLNLIIEYNHNSDENQ